MVKVKVLKLAGETGLRLPGTCYFETEQNAAKLCSSGLVSIASETQEEMKELKQKPETKELKFKRQTKKRK
jgi:hypothetical protein